MKLYYETEKVAVLPTEQSSILKLLTVLVPNHQSQIEDLADLMDLLCDRVEWMIRKWMADEEQTEAAAFRLISETLNQSGMYQVALPARDDSTLDWASALTDGNMELQGLLPFLQPTDLAPELPLLDFPLTPVTDRPDLIELIQETTLQEWLEAMGGFYQGNTLE